jgi:hypothetical protein
MGLGDRVRNALDADHDWFAGFDADVCYGEGDEYEGVCPKLIDGSVDRCGVCECTIKGLSVADTPPSKCVRLEGHTDAGQEE